MSAHPVYGPHVQQDQALFLSARAARTDRVQASLPVGPQWDPLGPPWGQAFQVGAPQLLTTPP